MHHKKIENLLKLSEDERLKFFVRYCADFEEVWGLVVEKDNWVTFTDSENDQIFPIWPHYDLAEYCCFSEHKKIKAMPQSITLEVFLEKCVPDMKDANIYFGVFYDRNKKGLAISPDKLKLYLEDEIQKHSG